MARKGLLVGAAVTIALLGVGGAVAWRKLHADDRGVLVIAGTIESRDVQVGSLVGGRIEQVHVDEGDLVERGAPLVTLEDHLLLLLALSFEYLVSLLALGLLISANSKTQFEAMQRSQLILLPSILLSGYIFPISSIPAPLQLVSHLLPATHFIAIARGIIVRGANLTDLWLHVFSLAVIAVVLVAGSTRAFRKTIS